MIGQLLAHTDGQGAHTVIESTGIPSAIPPTIACFMELLANGRIHLKPLITQRIDSENILETYREMVAGNMDMMGIIIKWAKD